MSGKEKPIAWSTRSYNNKSRCKDEIKKVRKNASEAPIRVG